jgi:Integrase core domain
VKTLYIEPGIPWENGFTESFNSRLRDELLRVEQFANAAHARAAAAAWREDYNDYRPHSSLDGLPPAEFARCCAASATAAPRRVGTGDCSPAPLTEPDLWAHIRLLKLNILEQHKLSLDLRGWLEFLPSDAQRDQPLLEPGVRVGFVDTEAAASLPNATNLIGSFPGLASGYAAGLEMTEQVT